MLAEPTDAERAVLGAIPYCTNHAQLHTDESVLPRHRRARASWNYLVTPNDDSVLVTYDVTRLMRLDGRRRFLVTLGGRDHVDPATVLAEMTYSHPMYTPESVAAQQLLPTPRTTTGWRSPARTTAGASTRTAPRRVCARPAASAPNGRRPHAEPRRWRVDPGAVPEPPDNASAPRSGTSLLRTHRLQLVAILTGYRSSRACCDRSPGSTP